MGTKRSSTSTYHMESIEFIDLSVSKGKLLGSSWDFKFSPEVIKSHDGSTNANLNELSVKRLFYNNKISAQLGRKNIWVFSEMLSLDGAEFVYYSDNYNRSLQLESGQIGKKYYLEQKKIDQLNRVTLSDKLLAGKVDYSVELLTYDQDFGSSVSTQYHFMQKYSLRGNYAMYDEQDNHAYVVGLARNNSLIQIKKSLARLVSNEDEDKLFSKLYDDEIDRYLQLRLFEYNGKVQVSVSSSIDEAKKYQVTLASLYHGISPFYKAYRRAEDSQDVIGIGFRDYYGFSAQIGEGLTKTAKKREEDLFTFGEISYEKLFQQTHLINISMNYLDNDEWINDDVRFSGSYSRVY